MDKSLVQVDATIRQFVTNLRDILYPTSDPVEPGELELQRKRIVVNYEPFFQVAELPVVILENIRLTHNLFYRDVGYEAPVKDMVPDPPEYVERKMPTFVDLHFDLVALTDKAMDTIPLHERLIAFVEASPYIMVGEEEAEPYESYEYGMVFQSSIGATLLQHNTDHLNQFTLNGTVEAVRVYPGIELVGKLVKYRTLRLYDIEGETLLEEVVFNGA